MTMVITSRLLPIKNRAAYSDYLVNFQRAQPSKNGQFSVRGNTSHSDSNDDLAEGMQIGRVAEIPMA